jgi:Ca-activated chloride channel family protein
MMFDVLYPQRLWWLALIPALLLLYAGILAWRRAKRGPQEPSKLEKILPKQQAWKRHLAVGLALLSLGMLTIAYAEPAGEVEVPRQRATVVLAIDVSISMQAKDIEPDRITAAQASAKEFLNMVPSTFNVALVTFSGAARLDVPPTTDRALVSDAIDNVQLSAYTAIGEGIYESLKAMKLAPPDPDHPDEKAPGVIVLLSDGSTNIGRKSAPAAKDAKEQGYPIYTIAFGTPDGCVQIGDSCDPSPVDHYELSEIARLSGGKKFEAESAGELREVYKNIAEVVGYTKEQQEITEQFAGFALIFAFLAALALGSLAARWP